MQEPLSLTYAKLREELATAEIELQNARTQMLESAPSVSEVFAAFSGGSAPPMPDPRVQHAREREVLEANIRIMRLKARLGAIEFAQRERLISALNGASSLVGIFTPS